MGIRVDLRNLETIGYEYVALDGSLPTPCPRGKERFVDVFELVDQRIGTNQEYNEDFFGNKETGDDKQLCGTVILEDWDWDGSSVNQAEGHDSDKILRPVRDYINPFEPNSILRFCEVINFDNSLHVSNSRGHLRYALYKLPDPDPDKEIWMAAEQEYFIIQRQPGVPVDLNAIGIPVGFSSDEQVAIAQLYQYKQGGDYCSATNAVNEIMKMHQLLCHQAGIFVCGTNAEVAPAQGEFQILAKNPLEFADDLTVARYLLLKLCAMKGVTLSLRPKLYPNLNGSGAHVNFSDENMRNKNGGLEHVYQAREKLEANYDQVIRVCGAYNADRLTGDHETAKIDSFNRGKDKSDRGVGDRGASARIPRSTHRDGYGRCELRVPAANMDPYKVATAIIESVWGHGFNAGSHGWVYPGYDYV